MLCFSSSPASSFLKCWTCQRETIRRAGGRVGTEPHPHCQRRGQRESLPREARGQSCSLQGLAVSLGEPKVPSPLLCHQKWQPMSVWTFMLQRYTQGILASGDTVPCARTPWGAMRALSLHTSSWPRPGTALPSDPAQHTPGRRWGAVRHSHSGRGPLPGVGVRP